jgi:hypothetical protein
MTQSEILSMTPDQLDQAIAEYFEPKPEQRKTCREFLKTKTSMLDYREWWKIDDSGYGLDEFPEYIPAKHPSTDGLEAYKLERDIKYLGYKSNNDRRAHGKHTLRFGQLNMFKKRFPGQTKECLIGKKMQQRLKDELESAIFYNKGAYYKEELKRNYPKERPNILFLPNT